MLIILSLLVGLVLLTNLGQGISTKDQEHIVMSVADGHTLESVVEKFPGTEIADAAESIVRVPYGTVDEYVEKFSSHEGVNGAYPIIHLSFEIRKYAEVVQKRLSGYLHGDFGSIRYKSNDGRIFPITEQLDSMLSRSLGYLIPALIGSVVFGGGVALWAVLQPRVGRFLDTLHVAMLGVPDFFIIVMLQFGAIFIDKQAGHTVVSVMQFAQQTPFLIPFLAIMIMPSLVIYGTLRIAFAREWDEGYIKTAFMKGLSRKSVVLRHIFRNTFEDFLSVLPRAISVALATMVVVEVMTGIVGIGGYAINTSVIFTDALPTTCAILAIFAVLTNVVVSFVRKRYVVNTKEGA